MRAVFGIPGADGGHIAVRDAVVPVAAAGQVLVRVRAAAINRGEIKLLHDLRSGNPLPVGVEFAGEVAQVGAGVTGWREGDRVMGHGRGTQAQFVIAAPLALMPVPPAMSWVDAASFPNVFITAHDAVVTNGQLQPGESILVNAASGGVGLAAIQIATLLGAKPVMASARSAAKSERLGAFGVDVAINTAQQTLVDAVMAATDKRGVDVIIDMVGAPVLEANLASLAVKGRLVQIARFGGDKAEIDLAVIWLKRVKLIGATFRTRTEIERLACIQACARDLLPHLNAGRIRLPIDRVFNIEAIADAHAYMLLDRHFGKIVLEID